MNAARWAAIFQRQNAEPPAGRLYLNAKTPSRPLGGYISTPKRRAARWAAIFQRQNAEPPAGRLYFNAIIV